MSLIVPPPAITSAIASAERLQDLIAKSSNPEFQRALRRASEHYLHWHRFRYQRIPEGVTHEELWVFLKLGRLVNRKPLSFIDKDGRPFWYWLPDSLLRALNKIDLWSGGNITSDQGGLLPTKEPFIIRSLMEEAIASSQLEGAATTRQVAKEMLRTGRKPKDQSEQMILNNWETMQFIREHRKQPLTPEMLLEIHAMVTAGTLKDPAESGTLRTRDDIVVEYNGETVHVPPKAETLPGRMEALCKFANQNDEDNWIHPVVKGAIIHFWLAYDHPFTDGNGRTARALMYHHLLSRDYLLFEYLAISRYIVRSPGRYVRAYLYTETDENDLTYFVDYNLRAIGYAFQDLLEYLDRKQRELGDANVLLRNYRGLNLRQKSLLSHAVRHPHAVYTIEAHKNYHGVVYQTARTDLMQLASKGFLKREKEGREYVFVASDKMIDKLRARALRQSR
jgi:Fic family protein